MSKSWLATGIALTVLGLAGCGEDAASPEPGPTKPAPPFEIEGPWLYLGPADGPHNLTISRTSMVYADVDGAWSSSWSLKTYDNGLHHFQVTFASGSGAYLPMGQSMSGVYDVSGTLLTVVLANGASYPQMQGAGTCTSAVDGSTVPECRLYVKH